tara:strand:+ start:311 stop:1333 length:1023 start_codon:yes stop_codon:yes gene_type:complete
MSKIIKFSKSYNNIFKIKKDFYESNKAFLKDSLRINKIYKKQPSRKFCKNCGSRKIKPFIKSHKIPYNLCLNCGHLNGAYQDTNYFAQQLYNKHGGKNYSKNYLSDYNQRVNNIYIPKVDFLKKVIKKRIKVLDLGCGAGHFVKALEKKKITAIGYDTSKELCNLGNKKLKKNKILHIGLNEIYQISKKENNINTLSLIHVLEHLVEPHKILESFKLSKIQYLYLAVPLFSLSTFIENSFPNIFPRQLSGGHTHLYTEKSLKYLASKYNLKIIGEYWFGTDIPDLMRSLINSGNILNKKIYLDELNKKFSKFIDEMQSVLDKNKVCSEVQIVFENQNIKN